MLFGAALSHASAQLTGSGSPQNRLSLRDGNALGFSRPNCFISEAVEGTENQIFSPWPLLESGAPSPRERPASEPPDVKEF